jgi:hypothetical protein
VASTIAASARTFVSSTPPVEASAAGLGVGPPLVWHC